MIRLLTALKHKILWAQKLIKTEGVLYLLRQLPETLLLKRDFFIFGLDVDEHIGKTKTVSLTEGWDIVHNDFIMLENFKRTIPNLPVEFSFGTIDGCKDFYMMTMSSNRGIEPMAIGWIYNNKCINRVINLMNDEAEIKHCVTLGKFRKNGVFSTLLAYILTDIEKSKYKRLFSVIEVNNEPSIRTFKKCGFTLYRKWIFRKLLGMRISPLFSTGQLPK